MGMNRGKPGATAWLLRYSRQWGLQVTSSGQQQKMHQSQIKPSPPLRPSSNGAAAPLRCCDTPPPAAAAAWQDAGAASVCGPGWSHAECVVLHHSCYSLLWHACCGQVQGLLGECVCMLLWTGHTSSSDSQQIESRALPARLSVQQVENTQTPQHSSHTSCT